MGHLVPCVTISFSVNPQDYFSPKWQVLLYYIILFYITLYYFKDLTLEGTSQWGVTGASDK